MRGYYSYGIGFGQVLQQAGGAVSTNLTLTSPTAPPTGGGTVLDTATVRQMQAVIAQRAGTGTAKAAPLATTGFTLLAPRQTAAHEVLRMSPAQIAAMGTKQVGGVGLPPAGGGGLPGGPTDGATDAQFATACASAQGKVVAPKICELPDGARVTVDAQGNAICANSVGKCAPASAGAGGALLLGGVALAALMLLR